jgi:hypothetical protein
MRFGRGRDGMPSGATRPRLRPGARVVGPLRPAFLLVGAGLVAAELIGQESLHDWLLGLAVGALIGLWIAIADSPPAHIERWLRGTRGERKTERALRPLSRLGWSFFHDLPTGRGNRDHVAVGPGGVFLIETKRPDGEVSVTDDGLQVQRVDDPGSVAESNAWVLACGPRPLDLAPSLPARPVAEAGSSPWSRCGRRSRRKRSSTTASPTYTASSLPRGCSRAPRC